MQGSVLLETGRFDAENHFSYFFARPLEVLSIENEAELLRAFERVEEVTQAGYFAAGFFGYECGQFFHPKLAPTPAADGWPHAWLGIYKEPVIFDHATGKINNGQRFPDEEIKTADAQCDVQLVVGLDEYRRKVEAIRTLIAAGDTYQVNLTDFVEGETNVSTLDLYTYLTIQQPVAYGAYLNLPFGQVLSLSPELFFRRRGAAIIVKPMKGTARRGVDLREDEAAARALQQDPKNNSEHVMIVDLLRNDLGKVCEAGSIAVSHFCAVERYRTLLQMTSTVTGTLKPTTSAYELFQGLFPSGSITGAPKLRTMQIIRSLECRPRGIYTGAIGYFGPQQTSQFNVAIRTVVVSGREIQMGVGGGIVADADAKSEYEECRLKTNFLTTHAPDFQLIETMRWDAGIELLDPHRERVASSAAYFEFPFSNEVFDEVILNTTSSLTTGKSYRLRLTLDRFGKFRAEASELVETPWQGRVKISHAITDSKDVFLRHKTTNREFYQKQFLHTQSEGFDEVLFVNENGLITEAANHNVLFRVGGRWMTPPLSAGVLPGTFRQRMLQRGEAVEATSLKGDSLAGAQSIALCNAVRGLRLVNAIYSTAGELVWERPSS